MRLATFGVLLQVHHRCSDNSLTCSKSTKTHPAQLHHRILRNRPCMTLELMEWPCKYLPSPDLPVTIDQRGARVPIFGIDTTVLPSTPFKVIPSTLTGFLHPSDACETEIVPTSEHTIMLKHLIFFKGFCKFKLYTPL